MFVDLAEDGQILSSENWTDVMYSASAAEAPVAMSWVVVIFLSGWLLFGNCAYLAFCDTVVSGR